MRRVLITGGTGFIGRHAVALLCERGFEVHVVSRRGPSSEYSHVVDLLDAGARRALVARVAPTHLLHLAWVTEHNAFWNDTDNHRWQTATVELTHEAAQAGCIRAVYAGSSAEYASHEGVCHEAAIRFQPMTLYGQAKLRTFHGVSESASRLHIDIAWARIFHVYGPHEDPRRLVPSIARALLRNEPAVCRASRHVRDFLHAKDVADALVTILVSEVTGAINIGSGEPVTLGAVCDSIARAVGHGTVDLGAEAPTPENPAIWLPDVSRLRRGDLTWSPKIDLAAGIRDVVASLQPS